MVVNIENIPQGEKARGEGTARCSERLNTEKDKRLNIPTGSVKICSLFSYYSEILHLELSVVVQMNYFS